jgi:SNF2 family DNA or RNA helicase
VEILIQIGKYPALKVTNFTHSLFLKFGYDAQTVAKVKSLPVRFYEPNNKVWEVPISDIDRIVKLFGLDNLTPFNDIPEFTQYINLQEAKKAGKKSTEELIAYYETIQPKVDYDFKTKPDGHQIEAFNIALTERNLFITDVMGLGKTKETIDICDYRRSTKQAKHVLIICGLNGLKYNWHGIEIPKHSYNNSQVLDGTAKQRIEKLQNYWMFYYNIVNLESIRYKENPTDGSNDNKFHDLLVKLCEAGKFEIIVVDEFHKANNHKSLQGIGLRMLKSRDKIALSGTPITKKIEKSWNMLNWMGLETAAYWNFMKRYCILGGWNGYQPTGQYQNLDELHERFDKFQIRRTKDILKLPPKVYTPVYVEMTPSEKKEYALLKNGIIRDAESGELKYIDPLAAVIPLRKFTDVIKIRAVKEKMDEIVENDQSAVIYSMYKQGIYDLTEELKEYKPIIVTGDVKSTQKRQELVNSFQDDGSSNIIMGTIQVLGTGYTLTRSQYVNFLNKSWTCTENEQAEDRCHRRGTTGSVTILSYIVKDTIDERVEEILVNDKMYISKVVDGIPVFKMDQKAVFNFLMKKKD